MPITITSEGYTNIGRRFRAFIGRNPPSKPANPPHTPTFYPPTPQSALLMNGLPIEILQVMFESFVTAGGHLEVLYRVSQRWRDAALGYPKLWSYIHISRDAWGRQSSTNSLATRVEKAILESQGNNLHVTIDSRTWGKLPDRPFTLALQECSGEESTEMWRWETLTLDLGDLVPTQSLRYFMPQLRELTYRTTHVRDFSSCFPYTAVLSTLRLKGDYSTTWPATIHKSVRHLHIECNESSMVWNALQQFTSIRSLFLMEMPDLKHVSKNETICLSKLRELRVAFPEHGFPSFNSFLQLPSLTNLTLYTTNRASLLRDQATEVSASFTAVLPKLEGLTIMHMGCSSAGALREILCSAAQLNSLVLNRCGRWEENQGVEGDAIPSNPRLSETFYHVLEDPLLCPRLVRCVIENAERPNLVTLRK
jgi:hypothetical protein